MDPLASEAIRPPGAYQSYLERSRSPLTSFFFALPLFIVYHSGLWWMNNFSNLRWANAADIAIADALSKLGIAAPFLSFAFVVVTFLTMHALSGRDWQRPGASTWLLMILESLVFALPVFILSQLVLKLLDVLPLSALSYLDGEGGAISWQANLILSCGAGVYEEFLFRLILMGGIALILRKFFGIKGLMMFLLAAVLQGLAFAASHHLPGSPEEITTLAQLKSAVPVLTFRTVAGIYFALIYIERGFGIAAGSHAGYDVMVVALELLSPQADI